LLAAKYIVRKIGKAEVVIAGQADAACEEQSGYGEYRAERGAPARSRPGCGRASEH